MSIYSYMYFFILTSVVNIPLSALLTFLLTNISQLDHLWSDMLCQYEGVVSNDFMNYKPYTKNCATSQTMCDFHLIFYKKLVTEG